ncbi:MAG: polysaccharide deacetylase family protein, partial [Curvibacter sp.]
RNNVQHALPVLQRCRFTATIYGVSGLFGGRNSWDEGLVAQKPLMDLEDWCCWRDAGMDIGSHTRTHARLTDLDDASAREEIAGSRQDMERLLQYPVRHFCYPYGLFSVEHVEMVRQAGYTTATTTRRGRVQAGDDRFALRRIMVACSTHIPLFATKVMSGYEDRRR